MHPHLTEDAGLTEQLALFSPTMDSPEGLRYLPEFVAAAIERELIGQISALPLKPFQFDAYEGKRRVASFGFRYDYALRRLQAAEPIPHWLDPLIGMVEAFGGPSTRVAQVLCTEYGGYRLAPGQAAFRPGFRPFAGLALQIPVPKKGRRKVATLHA